MGKMTEEIKILPLTRERMGLNLEQLIALERNWTEIGERRWTAENFLRELPKKWDLSYLAMMGDEVAGYSIGFEKHPDVAYFGKVIVDKKYRGHRIGQRMLESFADKAADLGLTAMHLRSQVGNEHANGIYFRAGFTVVDTTKGDDNIERYDFFKTLKTPAKIIQHSKPTLDGSYADGIIELIGEGKLADGSMVGRFEGILGNYLDGDAILTNSGSNALLLGLKSLGIKEGDDVAVPSYICMSVLQSVVNAGANPVLIDINRDDFNISPRDLGQKISRNTKAIIAAHMFGIPIKDFDQLRKYNIPIIEDCAQCFGSDYANKKTGSMGDIAILSFYATKLLTTGRGGALVTKNEDIAQTARKLMTTDNSDEFTFGHSFKMDDLHAYLGIQQFKRLPDFIKKRREIAGFYREMLQDTVYQDMFSRRFDEDSIFHRYIVLVEEPERAANKLKLFKVEASKPVYKPLHQLLGLNGNMGNTDLAYKHALSLPIYPSLDKEGAWFVAKSFSASNH